VVCNLICFIKVLRFFSRYTPKTIRRQHQTEPRHARKFDHGFQVLKCQPDGISFWFHGHDLTHFGWLVLIDKSCPGIASINARCAGWNQCEQISQTSQTQSPGLAQ